MQLEPLIALSLFFVAAFSTACTYEDEKLPEEIYITSVYDMTADFSAYRTFDLVEPEDVPDDMALPAGYVEANRVAVVQSITDELESRGLMHVENGADLRIATFVRHDEVEVTQYVEWWDYYYGYYWGYGYPVYDVDVTTLEVGTLIIDAVELGDGATKADDLLVYRGIATAAMPNEPTDVSDELPRIVSKMFDSWPHE